MKFTTLNSPKGPDQTKPASLLKSWKQLICLIFKDKNSDLFVFAAGKGAIKGQLAFLLIIG